MCGAFLYIGLADVTVHAALLLLLGVLVWVAGTHGPLSTLAHQEGCLIQDGCIGWINERGYQAGAKGQEQKSGANYSQGKRGEGWQDDDEAHGIKAKHAPSRDLKRVKGILEAMASPGHRNLPVYISNSGIEICLFDPRG